MPLVVLRAEDETCVLPIWVGIFEANAIALHLEGIETPRPMTHDLLRTIIETLGAELVEVTVTDLRDSTFVATVLLRGPGGDVTVDCRPSDAIALAVRVDAPIFAAQEVIEQARAFDPTSEDPSRLRSWLESLDDDELGHYEM
jgi:bifunctional DNase/RNase